MDGFILVSSLASLTDRLTTDTSARQINYDQDIY